MRKNKVRKDNFMKEESKKSEGKRVPVSIMSFGFIAKYLYGGWKVEKCGQGEPERCNF